MKILASAGLVIAIGILVLKLALAPFHERYDERECRQAYARARTLADTIAADFRPYAPASGPWRNRRCGEVRIVPASNLIDSHIAQQPNEEL